MHNKPEYLRTDNYYNLDNLKDGFHFEEYTSELLKSLDFDNVEVLQRSNDYGADVLAEYNGVKYAIQCKYYTSQTVGVSAVQEILGGTAYHNADKPVVATNYKFSPNAVKLARANNVTLWDRKTYLEMVETVGHKILINNDSYEEVFNELDNTSKTFKYPLESDETNTHREQLKPLEALKVVIAVIIMILVLTYW